MQTALHSSTHLLPSPSHSDASSPQYTADRDLTLLFGGVPAACKW